MIEIPLIDFIATGDSGVAADTEAVEDRDVVREAEGDGIAPVDIEVEDIGELQEGVELGGEGQEVADASGGDEGKLDAFAVGRELTEEEEVVVKLLVGIVGAGGEIPRFGGVAFGRIAAAFIAEGSGGELIDFACEFLAEAEAEEESKIEPRVLKGLEVDTDTFFEEEGVEEGTEGELIAATGGDGFVEIAKGGVIAKEDGDGGAGVVGRDVVVSGEDIGFHAEADVWTEPGQEANDVDPFELEAVGGLAEVLEGGGGETEFGV